MEPTRTVKELRDELDRRGMSIADLARDHGLRLPVVYDLLTGKCYGTRGECHRAAVILGLKEGELPAVRQQENAI